MSHKNVLKALVPLKIGGALETDFVLEGAQLDDVSESAAELLLEKFPNTAALTINDWERICGLSAAASETLQARRDAVVTKLRSAGGLSRAYFINLAANMGYTITIDEPFATEGPHVWRITVADQPIYEFYADQSCAEELLLDWSTSTALEGLFNELKPAHSRLIIAYS